MQRITIRERRIAACQTCAKSIAASANANLSGKKALMFRWKVQEMRSWGKIDAISGQIGRKNAHEPRVI
jgi:hypothetical protein